MSTYCLRFDSSARPALERLLDYLGLEVDWKGDMGIVSVRDFDESTATELAQQAAARRADLVPTALASPTASPLHHRRSE